MKTINIGDLVISKQGRDKGEIYLVTKKLPNDYFLCINGKNRKLECPKKKLKKHIVSANVTLDKIKNKLDAEVKIYDSEVYSAIKKFKETQEETIQSKKEK